MRCQERAVGAYAVLFSPLYMKEKTSGQFKNMVVDSG